MCSVLGRPRSLFSLQCRSAHDPMGFKQRRPQRHASHSDVAASITPYQNWYLVFAERNTAGFFYHLWSRADVAACDNKSG